MGDRERRLTERYERDESVAHRLDRNFGELLQELRVAQNGVQILFAFLLGIAFQQRFTSIDRTEKTLYLITLISAVTAAVLLIAPAAVHRLLFGTHRKGHVVTITGRLAGAGLAFLAVSMLGAVAFTLDFVGGPALAWSVVSPLAAVVVTTWLVVPLVVRRARNDELLPPAAPAAGEQPAPRPSPSPRPGG